MAAFQKATRKVGKIFVDGRLFLITGFASNALQSSGTWRAFPNGLPLVPQNCNLRMSNGVGVFVYLVD